MKFGICIGFEKSGSKYIVPHIDFIKNCGFDYLELPLSRLSALSDEEFEIFLDCAKDFPISIYAYNSFFPAEIKLVGDTFDQDLFLRYVKKAAYRAHKTGAKKIVLGSSGARNAAPGYPLDRAHEEFINCVKLISKEFKPYDIELEIEHLNLSESNIVTSFEESSRICKNLGLKNVKSIIDYFHFSIANEDLSLIETRGAHIGHVHFARVLGRTYPNVLDMPEFMEFLYTLKEIGYDDTFSMECSFPKLEEEPKEYKEVLDEIKKHF